MVATMIYLLPWEVSEWRTSLPISDIDSTHDPIGYTVWIIEGNIEILTTTYLRT